MVRPRAKAQRAVTYPAKQTHNPDEPAHDPEYILLGYRLPKTKWHDWKEIHPSSKDDYDLLMTVTWSEFYGSRLYGPFIDIFPITPLDGPDSGTPTDLLLVRRRNPTSYDDLIETDKDKEAKKEGIALGLPPDGLKCILPWFHHLLSDVRNTNKIENSSYGATNMILLLTFQHALPAPHAFMIKPQGNLYIAYDATGANAFEQIRALFAAQDSSRTDIGALEVNTPSPVRELATNLRINFPGEAEITLPQSAQGLQTLHKKHNPQDSFGNESTRLAIRHPDYTTVTFTGDTQIIRNIVENKRLGVLWSDCRSQVTTYLRRVKQTNPPRNFLLLVILGLTVKILRLTDTNEPSDSFPLEDFERLYLCIRSTLPAFENHDLRLFPTPSLTQIHNLPVL
ncbi:hypothetical protein CALCODRAFT_517490 [Calocera cornea HHB12733]|uniref:Uncharacterized protein n=1 Tax=Calocera cornea HHB12733 TaxID=1353952 RepID=A0A165FZB2_9BASI|nr:hypothetical protein CALCODRAFT_517490 [Calocera cornea HHB12733]